MSQLSILIVSLQIISCTILVMRFLMHILIVLGYNSPFLFTSTIENATMFCIFVFINGLKGKLAHE